VFPVDAEYELKLHLQTNYIGFIRGMLSRHEVELRLDGARLKTFAFGGEAPKGEAPASYERQHFRLARMGKIHAHVRRGHACPATRPGWPRLIQTAFPREHFEPEGIAQPKNFGFALAVDASAISTRCSKPCRFPALTTSRAPGHAEPQARFGVPAGGNDRRAGLRG